MRMMGFGRARRGNMRAMSRPRVRPEFVRPLLVAPQEFHLALAHALADGAGSCRGQTFSGGAILRVRSGDQRVWSPALHLQVERCEGDEWQIHGRFSPSSPVWTAFLAIYLVLVCVAIGGLCYGGAQITLGQTPWAFVAFPVALALAAFTYGAAFLGQGLGAEDMYELRSFVERVADGLQR
jgi:hypothetical protein